MQHTFFFKHNVLDVAHNSPFELFSEKRAYSCNFDLTNELSSPVIMLKVVVVTCFVLLVIVTHSATLTAR